MRAYEMHDNFPLVHKERKTNQPIMRKTIETRKMNISSTRSCKKYKRNNG